MPFHPSIRPFFLFKIVLGLLLFGACTWAWKSAGGVFANLWRTPDQQGARLLAQQQYTEAAQHFRDPLWQGTALYRNGQFKEAAAAFARVDSLEAAYNRGNALLMNGKYGDALDNYDRALQRRPSWREPDRSRAALPRRFRGVVRPRCLRAGRGRRRMETCRG